MADTRVRNGKVMTPMGAQDVDILVTGEKITGLVARDDPSPATETIDAAGKWVLPGLVDLHAHMRTPGLTHKEDFRTGSAAAAVGGFTTWVDMPNVEPPTVTVEHLKEKHAMAEADSYTDWGHFASASTPDHVKALAEAGVTGYKIFMIGGGYPHDDRIAVYDDSVLYQSFLEVEKTGLPCLVHPFSQEIFDFMAKQAVKENPDVPLYILMAEVYVRDILWRRGVATLLELQKETGVRLQVLHTHAAGSLRMLRKAKAEGVRVTAAIDTKYYHLKLEDYDRLGQRNFPGGYVTADKERMAEIWRSLADGTVDCIDSDHAPHTFDEVAQIWTAMGGSPQYDHQLSVLANDVNEGSMTMATLVRAASENPARLIGQYPNKGAIQTGTDADLVIVDLDKEHELRDGDHLYTKLKWTPYHGWTVRGAPVLTMLRGKTIAKDGKLVGEPGYGRYLPGVPQRFVEPKPGQSPGLALEPR